MEYLWIQAAVLTSSITFITPCLQNIQRWALIGSLILISTFDTVKICSVQTIIFGFTSKQFDVLVFIMMDKNYTCRLQAPKTDYRFNWNCREGEYNEQKHIITCGWDCIVLLILHFHTIHPHLADLVLRETVLCMPEAPDTRNSTN